MQVTLDIYLDIYQAKRTGPAKSKFRLEVQ